MKFSFSKKKEASKGKAPATEDQSQPQPIKVKEPYVPRYAARDGLIGAPSGGHKEEEKEAFKRAYQFRMSREMNASAMSLPGSSRMSPRPLSRTNSAMSLDWSVAGSSQKASNPFATPMGTRPGSYQSLPNLLAPGSPPVPAIPQQFAGSASPLMGSRNSSFYNPSNSPLTAYFPITPSASGSSSRPRTSQRQSYINTMSPLGRTPEASNGTLSYDLDSKRNQLIRLTEHSPVDTPEISSASSTASSVSDEAMEIAMKADSPAQYMLDNRDYSNDPRKFGGSGASTPRFDSAASTPRTYFSHPVRPEGPVSPVIAAAPAKKNRFSLSRKSTSATIAAH